MEQSDNMLLTTLSQFVPINSISSLKQIKSEDLFLIILDILQYLSIDTSQIKSMQKQKFRSMTKLSQKVFKQLSIELQLNDLMNPSINFMRKILLQFVNKISLHQNAGKTQQQFGYKQESYERKKRKKEIKSWLEDEWIHPQFLTKNIQYNAYFFPLTINKFVLKADVSKKLWKQYIQGNVHTTLINSINKCQIKQKNTLQNQGLTKKQNLDNTISNSKIVYSNVEDWSLNDQKITKLKKKINNEIEQVRSKEEIKNLENTQSIFNNQVQKTITQKKEQKKQDNQFIDAPQVQQSVETDNPFQRLKREAESKKKFYQNRIKTLLTELSQRKDRILNNQKDKSKLQQEIQVDEQKLLSLKQETEQLKKNVQKRQLMLNSLQSQKPIEQQIKKYEEDIKQIQKQAKNQIEAIKNNIKEIQEDSNHKIQVLTDLKAKLHKIQNEYKEISEEIIDKNQLKTKVKVNKSGISRLYYSKKISQIDSRWRETQRQTQKIKKNLQKLRDQTTLSTSLTGRLQTQIHNLFNSQKQKNQQQSLILRDIFKKCEESFKKTLGTLEKINDVKNETQQYQIKVHTLSGQNYKGGIQKINSALTDLKKQIQELKIKERKK